MLLSLSKSLLFICLCFCAPEIVFHLWVLYLLQSYDILYHFVKCYNNKIVQWECNPSICASLCVVLAHFNSLRPRQNGRHFADDIFKCIFLNENIWIPIEISLKFVPQGPINNTPALVQIMAWRRPGGKPLSGPMMVRLPTHICVTRPQWVNRIFYMGDTFGLIKQLNSYTYGTLTEEDRDKVLYRQVPL